MLLGNVNNIFVGTKKVLKVYVGGTQVWPLGGGGRYFRFKKRTVWLSPSNPSGENGVESDTDWRIED